MTSVTRQYAPRLIPYYGGKARLVKKYPAPIHNTICEPFAGGAAYSLHYADRRIILCEKWPLLVALWKYLIGVKPAEILALPLVNHVDELGPVCEEARHLVGWWLNTCTAVPCKQASSRAKSGLRPKSFWGEWRRQEISRQVTRIKHWHVFEREYDKVPVSDPNVTFFVDPPYQHAGKYYVHSSNAISFEHLSSWCRSIRGQAIVCENAGADWLPFRTLCAARSSATMKNTSLEVVWTN